MDWLNYHHLLYFWAVAREGGITRASRQLGLAPPTVSAQLATLERTLGEPLFTRTGRRLVLTEAGRLVLSYADQIFALGRELLAATRSHSVARPLTLVVGIADAVPKLIAYRLLEPAMRLDRPVHLVCRQAPLDRLLADLAVHAIDVVLSDAPAGPAVKVRVFHHLLGETGRTFFAAPRRARAQARRFPRSLDGAPFLAPAPGTAARGALERWFEERQVRPWIVGEFDDSALLKVFGQAGTGAFAAPTAIEAEVCRQYRVRVIGRAGEMKERFYAIAAERTLTHPALVAIRDAAPDRLRGGNGRAASPGR